MPGQREIRTPRPSLDRRTPAALARDAASTANRSSCSPTASRSGTIARPDGGIVVRRSAGGLVTALEPLIRACSGVWVAHGAGTADRAVVDRRDGLDVPPANPQYRLRRVWLDDARGARLLLRVRERRRCGRCAIGRTCSRSSGPSDFEMYRGGERAIRRGRLRRGGQRLAAGPGAGLSLRARAADDSRAPPAEHDRRVLAHSVAALRATSTSARGDVNCWTGCSAAASSDSRRRSTAATFVETVERLLEAHVDRDAGRHHVQRAPDDGARVSGVDRVAEPVGRQSRRPSRRAARRFAASSTCRRTCASVSASIGWTTRKASTRSFWRSSGCSTRTRSSRSASSSSRLRSRAGNACRPIATSDREWLTTADRINRRFGTGRYRPIVLLEAHHEPADVYRFLRAADLCYVGSLHDGMNLVAKEFVARATTSAACWSSAASPARPGSSTGALIVNPYDDRRLGAGPGRGVAHAGEEQASRMRAMRSVVARVQHLLVGGTDAAGRGAACGRRARSVSALTQSTRSLRRTRTRTKNENEPE